MSEDADEKTVKEVLGRGHFAFGAGSKCPFDYAERI